MVRLQSGAEFKVPDDTVLNTSCRGTSILVVSDSTPKCFVLVVATSDGVVETIRVMRIKPPLEEAGVGPRVYLPGTLVGVDGDLVLFESRGVVLAAPLESGVEFRGCGGDPIVPPDYPKPPDQVTKVHLRFDVSSGLVNGLACIQE